MTADTAALQELIAEKMRESLVSEVGAGSDLAGPYITSDGAVDQAGGHIDVPQLAAEIAALVAAEVRAAKDGLLTKRWVCQVARSGYHNGASCRPGDAHNDWGCDYYYEASIRATEYETGGRA